MTVRERIEGIRAAHQATIGTSYRAAIEPEVVVALVDVAMAASAVVGDDLYAWRQSDLEETIEELVRALG